MRRNEVILVTEKDEAIGVMEKMEVHRKGLLHRAFSIFIFDSYGNMLLQQRAAEKYHGGLLWTNACCSHPFPDEAIDDAAARRLAEELGFTTALEEVFSFTYKAEVENGLIEHEYDHVFVGEYSGPIKPNADEVKAFAYYTQEEISRLLAEAPQTFTSWFKIAFPQIEGWWKKRYVAA